MTIRVIVADDQDIIRTGLEMILDAQPGIEVIGTAAGGREAVALARELRPDVCLLDIRMPDMDGIEATRQLAGPDVDDPIAVVIITTFDLDEYVHGALKAGARGFLLKDAGPRAPGPGDPRRRQRRRAHRSERDGPATRGVLRHAQRNPTRPAHRAADRPRGGGPGHGGARATNMEIADELYISLSTVKTHLASLMIKLGARNRVEVAIWAYETGRINS